MAASFRNLVATIVARGRWKLDQDEDGYVLVIPQEGGRKQKVSVEQVAHEGEKLVRITSTIGPKERLDAERYERALALNFHLPYGCLALKEDRLVITETRPLRTTTPVTISEAIRYIARQADTYEMLIFRQDRY